MACSLFVMKSCSENEMEIVFGFVVVVQIVQAGSVSLRAFKK